ncbi:hypothetical protein [Helicobacter suis]|uniref:hypothetical protein n=1 Tax=Helicobacter suis TaxID=104628 RepID=UPI0013D25AF5|nr:hypothetical protein [Helicobacter suis]
MAEKYSKEWIEQYNKEVEAYNKNHHLYKRALEAKAMRFGVSLEEAKNIYWWDGAWWDGGEYLCEGDW